MLLLNNVTFDVIITQCDVIIVLGPIIKSHFASNLKFQKFMPRQLYGSSGSQVMSLGTCSCFWTMEKEKTRLSQEQFIEEKVKCRHCIRADSLLRDLGEFGRRLGEPSIPPPTSHQPPAFPFHLPPPPTSYLLPSGLLPFAKCEHY